MGEVLGARNPTTIREHLEAIAENARGCQWARADGKPCEPNGPAECDHCFNRWHAAAALAILKNAPAVLGGTTDRMRVIDDPDLGVGAEHAPKEHP